MKEMKPVAAVVLLFCFAAAAEVCAAESASAKGVGERHERTTERMYADQDAAAEKCRKLAAEGKYAEAIKQMQENVISPLELEASSVDSWKARKRLAEFSDELRRMKVEYGQRKLADARQALENEKYADAISLANDAILITELMRGEATPIIVTARGRQNAANRRQRVSADTVDPKLAAREKSIRLALEAARGLIRAHRYDEAMKKVEEVFILNPTNPEASYLASQIYAKFYKSGVKRNYADTQSQMAFEAWQWVEPSFPMQKDESPDAGKDGIAKTGNDYVQQGRLDAIIFPTVSFNDTDLEAVVQFMRDNAVYDPEKKGVQITFIQPDSKPAPVKEEGEGAGAPGAENEPNPPANEQPGAAPAAGDAAGEEGGDEEGKKPAGKEGIYITLNVKNVSLRELLDYVCYLTDLTYVVREDMVIFGAADSQMYSENYSILNVVKQMIDANNSGSLGSLQKQAPEPAPAAGGDGDKGGKDGKDDGGGDAPADAGGADAPAEVSDSAMTGEALKKFFTLYGVEFPKGSSISYYRGNVVMKNTAENHRRMAKLIGPAGKLNVEKPMIEVEVKSIELSEGDMEELGFYWTLGEFGKGNWKVYKGEKTKYDGSKAMMKMLDGMLSGLDSKLVDNLNLFPDLFGSWKPLGLDESINISLTIHALDRSDRTETISAPRVLVNNGQTATVKMTKDYYFPDDWEELELETDEVGDNGMLRVKVTPPSPNFADESEEIGTVFTVTPTILENDIIRLDLHPRITAYVGKDSYDVVVEYEERENMSDKWKDVAGWPKSYAVWKPVIATRSLDVKVDVLDGETLVIGGLSDSTSQKRLDKIPILGDIPFIGRLFQTQSETSTRRNMLIFVTARLIRNNGVPVKRGLDGASAGIPAVMR